MTKYVLRILTNSGNHWQASCQPEAKKGRTSFFIKRAPFRQRADLYSSERSNTRADPAMYLSLPATGLSTE
jgi:hypothetical protein